MIEHIGSRDARNNFADLLGRVGYGGQVLIVERSGTPLVAMIPLEMYERLVAARETRFQVLDRIRRQLPTATAEEVAQDVSAAINAVRGVHAESST